MTKAIFFLGRHAAGKLDTVRLQNHFDAETILTFRDLINAFRCGKIDEIILAHSSVLNVLALILFPFCKLSLVVHNHPGFQSRAGLWGLYDKLLLNLQLLIVQKRIFLSAKVQKSYAPKKYDYQIEHFITPSETVRKIKKNSSILFFGRYLEYKNIELVYNLSKIFSENNFTIASAGCSLKSTANCNVINTYISDASVSAIYDSNDILVLPYRDVSQSGPFYLGVEHGLTILCSDLPFFRTYAHLSNVLLNKNKLEHYEHRLRKLLNENS